ncbi:MAG: hypothetical protein HYX94_07670 [Chloroflexi bacterium]|nr:hypothetical protein [Chloroflexota bacterium]
MSDESLFEEDNYMNAIKPHVSDVWLDGNEEIVMVEAECPNQDCGHKVVSFFTMPRATSKVLECRICKTRMLISLPAA